MRRRNRDLVLFNLSALDVLATATGVFVLLAVLLMPYFRKTLDAQAAILDVQASIELEKNGISANVISMPNPGRFLEQDESWQETVLPSGVRARVAVEAGVSHYWHPFVGATGKIIGVDRFGASAPGEVLFDHYGLTAGHVAKAVQAVTQQN